MGISCRSSDDTGNQPLLLKLREEQIKFAEGSNKWLSLQTMINQIIAQNYLHYVNR